MRTKYFKYILLLILVCVGVFFAIKISSDRKKLDLSHKNLYAMPPIPDYVEELDLSHNHLSNIDIRYLPKGLKKINLSYNDLDVLPSLKEFALERIDLVHNSKSIKTIFVSELISPSLKYLDLSSNSLFGVVRLFDSNLETVNLSSNYLYGFYSNTPIKELDLSHNQLRNFYLPVNDLVYLNLVHNQNVDKKGTLSSSWLIDKPNKNIDLRIDIDTNKISYNNAMTSSLKAFEKKSVATSDTAEYGVVYEKDSIHFAVNALIDNHPILFQVYKKKRWLYHGILYQKGQEMEYYTGTFDSINNSIELTSDIFPCTDKISLEISDERGILSLEKNGTEAQSIQKIELGNNNLAEIRYRGLYGKKKISYEIYEDTEDIFFSRNFNYPVITTNDTMIDRKINIYIEQLALKDISQFWDMNDATRRLPFLFHGEYEDYIKTLFPIWLYVNFYVNKNNNSILSLYISVGMRNKPYGDNDSYSDIYSFDLKTGEVLQYKDFISDRDKLTTMIYKKLLSEGAIVDVSIDDITIRDRISILYDSFVFNITITNNGYIQNRQVSYYIEELKEAKLLNGREI